MFQSETMTSIFKTKKKNKLKTKKPSSSWQTTTQQSFNHHKHTNIKQLYYIFYITNCLLLTADFTYTNTIDVFAPDFFVSLYIPVLTMTNDL